VRGRSVLVTVATLLLAAIAIGGCGSEGGETDTSAPPSPAVTLTNDDWAMVVASPDGYKDTPAEIVGRIFQPPEADSEGITFQMWAGPANSEWNTIVSAGSGVNVAEDDYVRVVGTVGDQFEGENMMGAELTIPTIIADSVEIVDALAAAPAALKTVAVNDSQNQHGVTLTLKKVEFAKRETRVFLTVSNRSGDTASVYSFNAKAVQGSRQYSEAQAFMSGYPEIETDLLPKNKTSGVIVFPKMNPDKATRFVFVASSDNWNLTFKPYEFRVK